MEAGDRIFTEFQDLRAKGWGVGGGKEWHQHLSVYKVPYIQSTFSSCLTPPQSRERVLLSVFYQQGRCIRFPRAHPKARAVPSSQCSYRVRWAAPVQRHSVWVLGQYLPRSLNFFLLMSSPNLIALPSPQIVLPSPQMTLFLKNKQTTRQNKKQHLMEERITEL